MRQVDDRNAHRTADPDPAARIGLSEDQLTDLLERYRQNFNLGAGDLARLVNSAVSVNQWSSAFATCLSLWLGA